jgi:hypothetical protein
MIRSRRFGGVSFVWCLVLAAWAAALAPAFLGGCGGDDDDDDEGDDDTGDDDTGDDDAEGTAPVLDALNPYYPGGTDGVYLGDPLNLNVHFTDADANLQGGTIHFQVGELDAGSLAIAYDPGEEGYITTSVATSDAWPLGATELAVYVVDAAGEQSNTVTAEIRVLAGNTAPVISNLRFEPDPVCTEAEAVFTILFDYDDPDGNLAGGRLILSFDYGFPQAGLLPSGLGTEGTFSLEAWPTEEVPEGAEATVTVQISDSQNAMSEQLEETIVFSADGCDR